MIALAAEQLIGATAAVPLVVSATWATKATGRWLRRALEDSMGEAVTAIVKPHLEQLTEQLTVLRADNARDHAEVAARLNALEARVALVEARLTPITITEDKVHE